MSAPIHLKYWNGRGLMEVPRMLLAAAGKTGTYTDGRYSAPEGDLTANLGRMPICQVIKELLLDLFISCVSYN